MKIFSEFENLVHDIKSIHIAKPGVRIIKSVIGVFLCFVVYYLRGNNGMPIFSTLAVLQCLDPDPQNNVKNARIRVYGTFYGALWGLAFLLLKPFLFSLVDSVIVDYLMISIFTGVVLYTSATLNRANIAYFSVVVYLSIVINYMDIQGLPYSYVFDRMLDTLIGIALGFILNYIHIPRYRNMDTLFIYKIDAPLNTNETINPRNIVEINRCIMFGAKFSVHTVHTPARSLRLLNNLKLNLPIIVMEGSALYDVNTNTYVKTYCIDKNLARKVEDVLKSFNISYMTNVIIDNALMLYYQNLDNEALLQEYESTHSSPYRNYIRREPPEEEPVCYFALIEKIDIAHSIYLKLYKAFSESLRIEYHESKNFEGYAHINIYSAEATTENMIKELLKIANAKNYILFENSNGKLCRNENSLCINNMIKDFKTTFEPPIWKKNKSL